MTDTTTLTTKETLIQKIEHVAGVLELDAEHLYVLFHKELDKVLHVHAANPEAAKAFVSAAVTAQKEPETVSVTGNVAPAAPTSEVAETVTTPATDADTAQAVPKATA